MIAAASIVDAAGRVAPTVFNAIRFEVDGDARILGGGTGDPGSHEPEKCFETEPAAVVLEAKKAVPRLFVP